MHLLYKVLFLIHCTKQGSISNLNLKGTWAVPHLSWDLLPVGTAMSKIHNLWMKKWSLAWLLQFPRHHPRKMQPSWLHIRLGLYPYASPGYRPYQLLSAVVSSHLLDCLTLDSYSSVTIQQTTTSTSWLQRQARSLLHNIQSLFNEETSEKTTFCPIFHTTMFPFSNKATTKQVIEQPSPWLWSPSQKQATSVMQQTCHKPWVHQGFCASS